MKWLVMVEEVEAVVMDVVVEAGEVVEEDLQALMQRPWVEAAVGNHLHSLSLPRTIRHDAMVLWYCSLCPLLPCLKHSCLAA